MNTEPISLNDDTQELNTEINDTQISITSQETREQQYEKMILEYQQKHGCSRRHARRALEAHSKKIIKKFLKNKKNVQTPTYEVPPSITSEGV